MLVIFNLILVVVMVGGGSWGLDNKLPSPEYLSKFKSLSDEKSSVDSSTEESPKLDWKQVEEIKEPNPISKYLKNKLISKPNKDNQSNSTTNIKSNEIPSTDSKLESTEKLDETNLIEEPKEKQPEEETELVEKPNAQSKSTEKPKQDTEPVEKPLRMTEELKTTMENEEPSSTKKEAPMKNEKVETPKKNEESMKNKEVETPMKNEESDISVETDENSNKPEMPITQTNKKEPSPLKETIQSERSKETKSSEPREINQTEPKEINQTEPKETLKEINKPKEITKPTPVYRTAYDEEFTAPEDIEIFEKLIGKYQPDVKEDSRCQNIGYLTLLKDSVFVRSICNPKSKGGIGYVFGRWGVHNGNYSELIGPLDVKHSIIAPIQHTNQITIGKTKLLPRNDTYSMDHLPKLFGLFINPHCSGINPLAVTFTPSGSYQISSCDRQYPLTLESGSFQILSINSFNITLYIVPTVGTDRELKITLSNNPPAILYNQGETVKLMKMSTY